MSTDQWHTWNNRGRSQDSLTPLLGTYQPLVEKEVSRWSGSGLPRIVLETHAKKLVIQGFHSFKPEKGSQLSTHLMGQLKGMDRFVNQHRGDIRLPQEKMHLADKVFKAKSQLELELGREVTSDEVAERSGVGTTTIGKLKRFQSGLYSGAEAGGFNQPIKEDISHDAIVMGFLYQELSPHQKLVFDYSTGQHGKPTLSPGEIATRMGVSGARVSQLKNEIADKGRRYQRAVGSLMK